LDAAPIVVRVAALGAVCIFLGRYELGICFGTSTDAYSDIVMSFN
jgi:hypothetical protein